MQSHMRNDRTHTHNLAEDPHPQLSRKLTRSAQEPRRTTLAAIQNIFVREIVEIRAQEDRTSAAKTECISFISFGSMFNAISSFETLVALSSFETCVALFHCYLSFLAFTRILNLWRFSLSVLCFELASLFQYYFLMFVLSFSIIFWSGFSLSV
jgi:hypothetical protein